MSILVLFQLYTFSLYLYLPLRLCAITASYGFISDVGSPSIALATLSLSKLPSPTYREMPSGGLPHF